MHSIASDGNKAAEHRLILDAGDFGAGIGEANRLRTEYLLKGFGLLGYDAVTLGDRDLLYGPGFILEMRDKYDIPFVSANVMDAKTGKPFVEPYLIKRFGADRSSGTDSEGVTVGIFGVMMASPLGVPGEPQLEFRDPVEAAKEVVKTLEGKVDVIVCLAHVGMRKAQEVAKEVPGIDAIIAAHGSRVRSRPLEAGSSIIVEPGQEGKYIGDLTLNLDAHGKVTGHKGVIKALDASYKDDPNLAALVAEFEGKTGGK